MIGKHEHDVRRIADWLAGRCIVVPDAGGALFGLFGLEDVARVVADRFRVGRSLADVVEASRRPAPEPEMRELKRSGYGHETWCAIRARLALALEELEMSRLTGWRP